MQLRFGVEIVEAHGPTPQIGPLVNRSAPVERTLVVVVGLLQSVDLTLPPPTILRADDHSGILRHFRLQPFWDAESRSQP